MENPKELKYTKEHEWVKLENDIATIGITFHAQELLTDIVFVELPEKEKKAEQSKQIAVVESVKSVSDVFSPVTGEVTEANTKLQENPELINNDPYNEGWIAKIKVENKEELNNLMSAEEYKKYCEEH
jgi:glycine cleavage system H protein